MAGTQYSARYKAKLVLEALRGEKESETIAYENGINPNMLRKWKQEFLEKASTVFEDSRETEKTPIRKEASLKEARDQMPKTIVRVFFPSCSRTYTYYNDRFPLQPGDRVFVEGSMAGVQGEVLTAVPANGQEGPRVLSAADVQVSGTFLQAGSHLLTFDPAALPYQKFLSWVLPPVPELAEGPESAPIRLQDLEGLEVPERIFSRGADYYRDGRVWYLQQTGTVVRAVVQGTHPYPVRFSVQEGLVRRLNCGCPCEYVCKHQVAVLLQYKKLLRRIQDIPERQEDWTAAAKPVFFSCALDANPRAVLRMESKTE